MENQVPSSSLSMSEILPHCCLEFHVVREAAVELDSLAIAKGGGLFSRKGLWRLCLFPCVVVGVQVYLKLGVAFLSPILVTSRPSRHSS